MFDEGEVGFNHTVNKYLTTGIFATLLKGHCHGVFSAIFNKAGLEPWVNIIADTRNGLRTSRERFKKNIDEQD